MNRDMARDYCIGKGLKTADRECKGFSKAVSDCSGIIQVIDCIQIYVTVDTVHTGKGHSIVTYIVQVTVIVPLSRHRWYFIKYRYYGTRCSIVGEDHKGNRKGINMRMGKGDSKDGADCTVRACVRACARVCVCVCVNI